MTRFTISRNKFDLLAVCFEAFPGYQVINALKKKGFRYYFIDKTWSTKAFKSEDKLSAYITALLEKYPLKEKTESVDTEQVEYAPVDVEPLKAETIPQISISKREDVASAENVEIEPLYEKWKDEIEARLQALRETQICEKIGKKTITRSGEDEAKLIYVRESGFMVLFQSGFNSLPQAYRNKIDKQYKLCNVCY